eukprot:15341701-Heterocapsa_arctica.AAC.1
MAGGCSTRANRARSTFRPCCRRWMNGATGGGTCRRHGTWPGLGIGSTRTTSDDPCRWLS